MESDVCGIAADPADAMDTDGIIRDMLPTLFGEVVTDMAGHGPDATRIIDAWMRIDPNGPGNDAMAVLVAIGLAMTLDPNPSFFAIGGLQWRLASTAVETSGSDALAAAMAERLGCHGADMAAGAVGLAALPALLPCLIRRPETQPDDPEVTDCEYATTVVVPIRLAAILSGNVSALIPGMTLPDIGRHIRRLADLMALEGCLTPFAGAPAHMLAEDMAQAVGMLEDGLPEGMVAQTLLAGRAGSSPAWVS